jgi:flagellar L-ring protein precursor FlgH
MKFLILFLFTSCASYVQSIHQQIDNDENAGRPPMQRAYDPYSTYRKTNDKRPINNPLTYNSPNTENTKEYLPSVKRQYKSEGQVRHKAQDLVDNDNSGSLWTGDGETGFFFNPAKAKQVGDIIVVEVNLDLKNQITSELKRAFPTRPLLGPDGLPIVPQAATPAPATAAGATPAANNTTPPNAANKEDELETGPADKVYDKISTAITEEISRDYVLLKGQKEILFKGAKRYIEFQGLVSKKEIAENNAIMSSKLLEPRVYVLR